MNEIGYKDALKLAADVGKTLVFPDDFVIKQQCKVIEFLHVDGSYCKFVSACFKKIADDWIAIYTEHHGKFVYHTDDVKWVRVSSRPENLYYNDTV